MRGIERAAPPTEDRIMPLTLPLARRRERRRVRDEHRLLDVAMVACAPDGRLTHVNLRTRELIGAECAAGMELDAWVRRLAPRTPSGVPLVLEDVPLLRALDGEVVRAVDVLVSGGGGDLLLSTSANPVSDERGRRRGALAVFEDVTEQRAQEVRMRARGARALGPPKTP
jgi:PAS domain-containing protein